MEAPRLDCADYVAVVVARAAPPTGPPAAPATQEALRTGIARHGLRVVEETASDGECGIDAMLHNLERLRPQTQKTQDVLATLARRGREAAFSVMRLQLLIRVRDHATAEVVPGVSLSELLGMDGFTSVGSYIQHMRQPKTWIDTPMLWAMASVYRLQLVVFVGAGDPQVILAPEIASEHTVHTAYLANFGNVHFWALEPDTTPQPLENSVGRLHSFGDLLLPFVGASEVLDAGDAGEEQGVRGTSIVNTNLSTDLFAFATALMQWDAFGPPQAHMGAMIKALEAGMTDLTSHVFQVLQWRDALRLAEWEHLDKTAGMDRDVQYQVGKNYLASTGARYGRFDSYQKSRKIAAKLDLQRVTDALLKPCGKIIRPIHASTCFEVFRPLCYFGAKSGTVLRASTRLIVFEGVFDASLRSTRTGGWVTRPASRWRSVFSAFQSAGTRSLQLPESTRTRCRQPARPRLGERACCRPCRRCGVSTPGGLHLRPRMVVVICEDTRRHLAIVHKVVSARGPPALLLVRLLQ